MNEYIESKMSQTIQNPIKGCYLHYQDILHNETLWGSDKKVAAQIKAFNAAGLTCDFIFCEQPKSIEARVLSCLPFTMDGVRWPDPERIAEYSFVYIRRPRFISRELIQLIKEVKKRNPNIQVILEIPTYPYDSELKTFTRYPALLKDRKSRKELKSCIDRIAIISSEVEVFGIETIPITNGIDLDLIAPKKPVSNLDEVGIITVAYFTRWHGLDRLIAGMINYYRDGASQRKVVLHVAGTGDEIKPLMKQVNAVGLEDRIIFHGYCDSDELNMLYDQCSLAVESLGFHRRSGVTVSASLKSREYLAKGIPFICANEIDVFVDSPVDFFLQVPGDENPINIESLLCFHDRLYETETQENLVARIRLFAESHVNMDKVMGKVVSYITENCNTSNRRQL